MMVMKRMNIARNGSVEMALVCVILWITLYIESEV